MKATMWAISIFVTLGLLAALGESQVTYSADGATPAHASAQIANITDGASMNRGEWTGVNVVANNHQDASGAAVIDPTTFTLRPTAYAGNPGYTNPTYAYDGNFSTASSAIVFQTVKGATARLETWFGFPARPPGATGLTLDINSAASTGFNGYANMYYSLDGGSTYKLIYGLLNNQSRGQQTDVIALSDTQDLTKVRIEAQDGAIDVLGMESNAAQWVYEIWISGND
jgi:hypothetical protein